MLFVGGAVVADLMRDDTETSVETTATTTTTQETVTVAPLPRGGGGTGASGLPDAYVVKRYRDSPVVPPTDVFTELVHLKLDPGRYQVFGRVSLHSRDGRTPFRMSCALVPSNPDGTPRQWGELGSDVGHVYLAPSNQPGQEAQMTLLVSQVLSRRGEVVLGCSGEDDANEHGAFANYTSIHAIEVGSIRATEEPVR